MRRNDEPRSNDGMRSYDALYNMARLADTNRDITTEEAQKASLMAGRLRGFDLDKDPLLIKLLIQSILYESRA